MTANEAFGIENRGLQTFYQPNGIPGDRSQRCPICLQGMPPSERYPTYVCAPCTALAVDENGKPVEIGP